MFFVTLETHLQYHLTKKSYDLILHLLFPNSDFVDVPKSTNILVTGVYNDRTFADVFLKKSNMFILKVILFLFLHYLLY